MKKEKIIICLASLGCVLVLFILSVSLGIFGEKKNADLFPAISVDEVIEVLEEKRDIVIYCGQETCSACRTFSPLVEKVSKEQGRDVYYLDVDSIASQKELQEYQIQETPTLINVYAGQVYIYRGTMNEEEIRKAISGEEIENVELEGIVPIDYNTLKKVENQPKDFILYIGREDCQDCQKFGPILEDYLRKNSGGVYYLSLKEYREKAKREGALEEDIKKYEEIMGRYDVDWVPTLLHIRNGIRVSRYKFLDQEYGELTEQKKKEYEDEYILRFYEWMDRERDN